MLRSDQKHRPVDGEGSVSGGWPGLKQTDVRNQLLRRASPSDFARLAPHLTAVRFDRGQFLDRRGACPTEVVFPESLIASVVATSHDDRRMEIGQFGRDGMSGSHLLVGAQASAHDSLVQVAGEGLSLASADLLGATNSSPTLADSLRRYLHAFSVQVADTVLSTGCFTIEQRLARWLLMAHDRLESDELSVTHDVLALMLSVRRSGVTLAIHLLEGAGAVRASRGHISIRDRGKLKAIAGHSYGGSEPLAD